MYTDEIIDLVDDDEATTDDVLPVSQTILKPSIEINLTASQSVYGSLDHILSLIPPSIDRYVKIIPSKAMELSAIPFLDAVTPSL